MDIKKAYRSIVLLIKRLRNILIPVLRYEDPGAGHDKLSVVFIGWDRKLRNYWLQRVFGNDFILKNRVFLPPERLSNYLSVHRSDADLAIVEVPDPHKELNVGQSFILPNWMEFVMDLEEAFKKLRIKEILRRIRKYDIDYELRDQRKDLDFFYHRMYKPLIRKNHGNAAELARYGYFYSKFKENRLEIMFLRSEGKILAGSILEKGNGLNRILAFGVLDGSIEIIKTGVHAAAYYFTMQKLMEQGHKKMLCGSSMPAPLDGVTQFKLRMGAKPYLKDLSGRKKYRVVLLNPSQRVLRVMKDNPLYYLSGENLKLAAFMDGDEFQQPKEFNRYLKLISSEHVDTTECYILDNKNKLEHWIRQGEVPRVELIDYETVVG